MGFWDDNPVSGSGFANKDELAASGEPFGIVAAEVREDTTYGGEQVILTIAVEGDEENQLLGFKIGTGVESRDKMLTNMVEYFEDPTNPDLAGVLSKAGNAFILTGVETGEAAKPARKPAARKPAAKPAAKSTAKATTRTSTRGTKK